MAKVSLGRLSFVVHAHLDKSTVLLPCFPHYLFVDFLMRKLLASTVADVPPLHLNSRNDMLRANAVEIIASPRTSCFFGIYFFPAVVSTISILHRYSATISMLVLLAVEPHHYQQVLAHRFF